MGQDFIQASLCTLQKHNLEWFKLVGILLMVHLLWMALKIVWCFFFTSICMT
jgi:hypothetical protein